MKSVVFALLVLLLSSCKKGFIEAKVSSQYELADNLNALEGLLNNDELMGQTPVLGEESCDDHYLTENFYDGLPLEDKNAYTWKKDIFEGKTGIPDWDIPYRQVFTCNMVLDGLEKITPGVLYQQQWNEIKGNALFYRSYAFFNIFQVFAKAYDSTYADQPDLGVSMPLTPSTEIVPPRSTINETYDTIIGNLELALPLVSTTISAARNKPNKAAVFALLARVYLSKRNYTRAGACADSSLQYQHQLIDYNTLDTAAKFPIAAANVETLYQSCLINSNNVIQGKKAIPGTIIDSVLYSYYEPNDLRLKIYFTKGRFGPIYYLSYTGNAFPFSGLASDENYLIRAECNARANKLDSAMADLNLLLQYRYVTGTAPHYKPASQKEAIDLIVKERRKELAFRGLRWPDIKRLNKEEAMEKIMLKRTIKNQSYLLLPSSDNYALPLPDDATRGNIIKQNVRE